MPQGSILGPLLFLIKDLSTTSNILSFFLFVDDTNILYANKCPKKLELHMNDELLKVQKWLTANKLTLNIKKSNFIIFHPSRHKLANQMSIKIFDHSSHKNLPLERKQFIKYLGVLTDEHLSWKTHIDSQCNKISRIVGVISKLRHCLPTRVLLTMYRSMIHPSLLYGISIWGQASKLLINKLLVLQKRALRSIFFKKITECAIPLFIENNILPVTLLYLESISHLMFDVINNNAPVHIQDMFITQAPRWLPRKFYRSL